MFSVKIYQWLCWEEEKKSVSCTPDDGHSSRLQLQDQCLKSIKPPPLNQNSFNSCPSSLLSFVTAANFNKTISTLPVMSEWSRRHWRPLVWAKLWMPHLEEGSLHTSESVCCCIRGVSLCSSTFCVVSEQLGTAAHYIATITSVCFSIFTSSHTNFFLALLTC